MMGGPGQQYRQQRDDTSYRGAGVQQPVMSYADPYAGYGRAPPSASPYQAHQSPYETQYQQPKYGQQQYQQPGYIPPTTRGPVSPVEYEDSIAPPPSYRTAAPLSSARIARRPVDGSWREV